MAACELREPWWLLATELEKGPCPHWQVPVPSVLATGYVHVCPASRSCPVRTVKSVCFMGLLRNLENSVWYIVGPQKALAPFPLSPLL